MNRHYTKEHTSYYITLIAIVFFGLFLSLQFAADRQLQMITVMLTVLLYIGWGILHHYLRHDLSVKIVVEYMLIGGLGMTVVLFLLKGGF